MEYIYFYLTVLKIVFHPPRDYRLESVARTHFSFTKSHPVYVCLVLFLEKFAVNECETMSIFFSKEYKYKKTSYIKYKFLSAKLGIVENFAVIRNTFTVLFILSIVSMIIDVLSFSHPFKSRTGTSL